MDGEVRKLEAEVKEYMLQLETVQSALLADPDNTELQNLTSELNEAISLTELAIAELKPQPAPQKQTRPPSPPKEKWSRENHPAFKAGYKKPSIDNAATASPTDEAHSAPVTYSVNDTVLAKWVSGDNSFYPARINSITGSSTAPVYIVKFKSYNTTETLSAKDIKPIASAERDGSKKRKLDSDSSTPTTPTLPSANSAVISAAANIQPDLAAQAKREPSKISDGPTRPPKVPKKIGAKKELESGKQKWQDFAAKGKAGKGFAKAMGKKESMFRTPEGVHGRVGFTGSGQPMRKDPTRERHIYQYGQDEEQ